MHLAALPQGLFSEQDTVRVSASSHGLSWGMAVINRYLKRCPSVGMICSPEWGAVKKNKQQKWTLKGQTKLGFLY